MALGQIDYYLLRPAVSPDELFHHTISGLLLDWTEARRIAPHTTLVVGETWEGRAHELRSTLQRCAIPHAFYLRESREGRSALAEAGPDTQLPCLIFPDGKVLNNPTDREIADATGTAIDHEGEAFDVIIIGAGPAGLAAAVHGASEGLDTLVVDEGGIGGQATSSSLIRNYLGFPRGISGRRLGQQAYEQAWVFGAKFTFMHAVTDLSRVGGRLAVTLSDDRHVSARAVILAMGATYRRLGVPALESLTGAGVFYGGTVSEAPAMAGKDAYVVGGANSAGQAALHLADYASRVTLVVRTQSLDARMSRYLVHELEATPNVDVRLGTEVVGGGGDGRLEYLELRAGGGGRRRDGPRGWAVRARRGPPADRLAARRDRQGPAGVSAHRHRSRRRSPMAARAPAVVARNEHAGRVRNGRRAPWVDQAGGLRGRRGVDCDPARPQPVRSRAAGSRGPGRGALNL